jgi:hypothetical protein
MASVRGDVEPSEPAPVLDQRSFIAGPEVDDRESSATIPPKICISRQRIRDPENPNSRLFGLGFWRRGPGIDDALVRRPLRRHRRFSREVTSDDPHLAALQIPYCQVAAGRSLEKEREAGAVG